MAALACETGIAPQDLLDAGDVMMETMWEYLADRAKQTRGKR